MKRHYSIDHRNLKFGGAPQSGLWRTKIQVQSYTRAGAYNSWFKVNRGRQLELETAIKNTQLTAVNMAVAQIWEQMHAQLTKNASEIYSLLRPYLNPSVIRTPTFRDGCADPFNVCSTLKLLCTSTPAQQVVRFRPAVQPGCAGQLRNLQKNETSHVKPIPSPLKMWHWCRARIQTLARWRGPPEAKQYKNT